VIGPITILTSPVPAEGSPAAADSEENAARFTAVLVAALQGGVTSAPTHPMEQNQSPPHAPGTQEGDGTNGEASANRSTGGPPANTAGPEPRTPAAVAGGVAAAAPVGIQQPASLGVLGLASRGGAVEPSCSGAPAAGTTQPPDTPCVGERPTDPPAVLLSDAVTGAPTAGPDAARRSTRVRGLADRNAPRENRPAQAEDQPVGAFGGGTEPHAGPIPAAPLPTGAGLAPGRVVPARISGERDAVRLGPIIPVGSDPPAETAATTERELMGLQQSGARRRETESTDIPVATAADQGTGRESAAALTAALTVPPSLAPPRADPATEPGETGPPGPGSFVTTTTPTADRLPSGQSEASDAPGSTTSGRGFVEALATILNDASLMHVIVSPGSEHASSEGVEPNRRVPKGENKPSGSPGWLAAAPALERAAPTVVFPPEGAAAEAGSGPTGDLLQRRALSRPELRGEQNRQPEHAKPASTEHDLPVPRQEVPGSTEGPGGIEVTKNSRVADRPSGASDVAAGVAAGTQRSGTGMARVADGPKEPASGEARNLRDGAEARDQPAGIADRVTLQVSDAEGRATRIRVSVLGDQVRAVLQPSDTETARHLERRMDELQQALVRQGFTDSKVTVQAASSRAETATAPGPAANSAANEPANSRGMEQPPGDQRQGSGQRGQGRQDGRDPQSHQRPRHRARDDRE
jgi:Flagellar hook-length control protein FliK